MPTVVHFEIPADDLARAKKFYQDLFDWKIEPYGGDSSAEYLMIQTTGESEEPVVCGGMMARQQPGQPITNYISVASIDEYAAKVGALGGQILVPKTLVPEHGHFAVCLDTEGNVFGLWKNL
ncbi:MAG: VOC family protein [Pirellulales bacterium]|nr:VOC family protein [Pirellulales bacterium]